MRLRHVVLFGLVYGCKAEVSPDVEVAKPSVTLARAVAPRAAAREALNFAKPKGVSITSFDEMSGSGTIVGRAESSAHVTELIVALKDIVVTPKGLGRVVERARTGNFRVEQFAAPHEVLEYLSSEVHFFFSDLELKPAEGTNTFEITLNVQQ